MFKTIREDIRGIMEKDPAARSVWEIIFCYPGFHILYFHRLAHWCWTHRLKFFGRYISHLGRFFTGIEIHPGAKVGKRVLIDHGMGVVIGETAEIGDNVLIYQGVTLGGTSLEKKKRHPTIEDNVVIGSGAKILGPFRVGKNSRIGSGSVVVKEVPADSVVVGIPGRVTFRNGKRVQDGLDVDQTNLPDPVAQAIQCLIDRINELEREMEELRKDNKEVKKSLLTQVEIDRR